MVELLLTTRVAAARCGTNVRTFLRMVEAGRITPKFRISSGRGGAMAFDPAEVEALREELLAEILARFEQGAAS